MKKLLLMILSVLCLFSFAMASACSCGGDSDKDKEKSDVVVINGFNTYHDMVVIYLNPSFVIGNFELNKDKQYVVEGDASYKFNVASTGANQPELKMPATGLKNDLTDVAQFGLYVYNANDYTFDAIVTAYSGDNIVCSLLKKAEIGANNLLFDLNRVVATQTGKVITDYSISFSGLQGESVVYLDNFHVVTTNAEVTIPANIKEVLDGISNITYDTPRATLESLVSKYYALSEEEKKCVSNYDSLTAAIMPYWLDDLDAAQTSDPGTFLYFDKAFGPVQVESAMAGISSYSYTTEKAYGDEAGSLKVVFEKTGTNWVSLYTAATTPIEEENVRFYVYNDSDQYKAMCVSWHDPSAVPTPYKFMTLEPNVWTEVTVKSEYLTEAGSLQFCGLSDNVNKSARAPLGNIYISSVLKRSKYQDVIDARTGDDTKTLFFFDRQLGIKQLSIDTDKILATVSSEETFNGESTTELVFKNVYGNGYINVDISGYEFNAGDVAVFYAKTSDMKNGLDYVDIRLNTEPVATSPLNGNHLVKGKWTMCLIPAARLEEALTQLYFYGWQKTDNSDGYYHADTTWSIYGSIYLTKIKVYSADEIKKMTAFDSTTEYQVGQTTFVGPVVDFLMSGSNVTHKGTYNANPTVFGSEWDMFPYLIGNEVRMYARSDNADYTNERPIPDANTRDQVLGFELKDAVTISGNKLYVVAAGLTDDAYIQVMTGRETGHYSTHSIESKEDAGDGYVRYCFSIADDWYGTTETLKYFRLFTGHKLAVPEYEAVMISNIYIAA